MPSRRSSPEHTTTIVAGMRRTSGERERTVLDVMPRSPDPALSAQEFQGAREYLARTEIQQYLRACEVLHTAACSGYQRNRRQLGFVRRFMRTSAAGFVRFAGCRRTLWLSQSSRHLRLRAGEKIDLAENHSGDGGCLGAHVPAYLDAGK